MTTLANTPPRCSRHSASVIPAASDSNTTITALAREDWKDPLGSAAPGCGSLATTHPRLFLAKLLLSLVESL
ncbi:hypothetical protein GCM10022402_32970 [Salinactinospora qingdaonensis]|uniref:Uncharacterized protein n=1 Tax=Salinactinospora qingdaonensis TaxID=702744 RepID=A0ABP7FXW6_9ACTN